MTRITKKTVNRYFIWLFVTVILILLLPIKFPLIIKSYGKIYPSKEWHITKGQNETIATEYIDRLQGGIKNYYIASFERGDIVSYNLEPKVIIGSKVCVGDTIGRISSNILLQLQSELLGDIEIAVANLNVFQTQETQSLVDEAHYQVEYAQTQFENQKIIFDRISQLYMKDLISEEEFDSVRTMLRLFEKDIQIAEAQLNTVLNGAKPETIELLKSDINALQDQYSILSDRINQGFLVSPIDGIVINSYAVDTLLSIQDTRKVITLLPIPWRHASLLKMGQEVHIRFPEGENWNGFIRLIDNNIKIISGKATVIVTVELEEGYSTINIGQVVECKIYCESTTLLNKISHFVRKNTI